MAVERSGSVFDAQHSSAATLEDFCLFVQSAKVVNLDVLAAEFGIRISDAVQRIEELQKMKRLSGVFDDRGKFVVVTQEEQAALADAVRARGRVSLREVEKLCSQIVIAEPKPEVLEHLRHGRREAVVFYSPK
mmetsp:Transcript_55361/g.127259  ORF Transcript_55361/g.127259 Transcript_55361/m.127259 type:complete len:133 (-) Transcript_55361:6-404(-)